MFKNRTVKGDFIWSQKQLQTNESVIARDTENGRFYEVSPNVFYPSITTVLSDSVDLSEWIERVGVAESNRIKNTAAARGTQMHDLLERYISNKEINLNAEMPSIKTSFTGAKSTLDKINHVKFQETALWSNALGVAGRVDLVANYEDIPSIIDFKTSGKPKKKEYIENYFCQATAYSLMVEERFGYKTKQIVIMILVDGVTEPQVFIENPDDYIVVLKKKIKNFGEKNNGASKLSSTKMVL